MDAQADKLARKNSLVAYEKMLAIDRQSPYGVQQLAGMIGRLLALVDSLERRIQELEGKEKR